MRSVKLISLLLAALLMIGTVGLMTGCKEKKDEAVTETETVETFSDTYYGLVNEPGFKSFAWDPNRLFKKDPNSFLEDAKMGPTINP